MQIWPSVYGEIAPICKIPLRKKCIKNTSQSICSLFNKIGLFFILFSFVSFLIGYGQNTNFILGVDFKLVNDKIEITYNIINYKFEDRFNISPQIFIASGVKLEAKTFTGDLKNVAGGPGKKIIWHIDQDNIVLNNDIYVILTGEKLATVKTPKTNDAKSVSRGACVMESILFPGLGTTRLSRKKGHLLKGFLGYGSAATAFILYNSAVNSYDDYKMATTTSDRDFYYNKVSLNTLYSKIFMAGAATIWTIEFISVLSVKNKSSASALNNSKISIGCDIIEKTPVLALKIDF